MDKNKISSLIMKRFSKDIQVTISGNGEIKLGGQQGGEEGSRGIIKCIEGIIRSNGQ